MKIIGHRGAAGLALENTTQSIKSGIEAGVDAVEFDVRVTKDGKLVLSHDRHLGRVSKDSRFVRTHSLKRLRQVPLNNGQKIATLAEAVQAAGKTSLVIEGKEDGWARPLAKFLQSYKKRPDCFVTSFNHRELYTFSLLEPEVPVYALEHTKPFDVIRSARLLGFDGIDINFWLLNPITYALARYHELDIIVYTINSPLMARFVKILYPRISITTDVPNKLQFLRKKPRKSNK